MLFIMGIAPIVFLLFRYKLQTLLHVFAVLPDSEDCHDSEDVFSIRETELDKVRSKFLLVVRY